MIIYVLNRGSRAVHKKVDGRSDERCNLDAIYNKEESILLGELQRMFGGKRPLSLCKRCFTGEERRSDTLLLADAVVEGAVR